MRTRLIAVAVAGLVALGAAGCQYKLQPGRDYVIDGDSAKLSAHTTAQLTARYRACEGDRLCTATALKQWNFGQANFFADHGPADAFVWAAGGAMPGEVQHIWVAMPALAHANHSKECIVLHAGMRDADWWTAPC